jgi:hypothetical protein
VGSVFSIVAVYFVVGGGSLVGAGRAEVAHAAPAAVVTTFDALAPDAPSQPPARICGNARVLSGPSVRPEGAVLVRAGQDNPTRLERPHTTYWFAPGVHTLGTGIYDQIIPGDDSTYIGAPDAILSGQHLNDFAFTQHAVGVTIEYLTIEDFVPVGSQGAVNHDSGAYWNVRDDTIQDNVPGAAVMIGSHDVVTHDCLKANGQYGLSAYLPNPRSLTGGPNHITVDYNEITENDTCNWELSSNFPIKRPSGCGNVGFTGCGCSGGGKFWEVDGANVLDNYIHDNFNVGLWADTNNTGFDISGNYVSSNWNEGLIYEVSYNAQIDNNSFVDNAWGGGPANPSFPVGAIYVSESGGDSRVPGPYSGEFQIDGNVFVNNWSGVVLWENANRFCGTGPGINATGVCTLVDRRVANIKTCNQTDLTGAGPHQKPDYYDLCRWKTQNVTVSHNVFNFERAAVPGCEGATNGCGENGLFSEYGSYPSWSPYTAYRVPHAMTYEQGNRFSDNVYSGAWRFMVYTLGLRVGSTVWQDTYHQDLGSRI